MNIEKIMRQASTVKMLMEALSRRVQGKPGHQHASSHDLLVAARGYLDEIETELTRADQDHLYDEDAENMAAEAADKAERRRS